MPPGRKTARQAQDAGTDYAAALAHDPRFTRDEILMAIWCESVVSQSGGYSPRLIWNGAVAAGLAPSQLYAAWEAGDRETLDILTFTDFSNRRERKAAEALARSLPHGDRQPSGHPAHQVREFRITVRHGADRARAIRVQAQTGRDAVLRAGLALAAQGRDTDPDLWIVTGVHDPAAGR